MNTLCWLLLEKSDATRVSKGIDGYRDITGDFYHYDSLVPNYRNLKLGDSVVIRKEDEILGIGKIGDIIEKDTTKRHRRCPACKATDIRDRKSKTPMWKCGKCGNEFSEPLESTVNVQAFSAKIEGFAGLKNPPSVQDVKSCATKGDGRVSQLSILNLDPKQLSVILEGAEVNRVREEQVEFRPDRVWDCPKRNARRLKCLQCCSCGSITRTKDGWLLTLHGRIHTTF
jgi:ribosomal protein S27AE